MDKDILDNERKRLSRATLRVLVKINKDNDFVREPIHYEDAKDVNVVSLHKEGYELHIEHSGYDENDGISTYKIYHRRKETDPERDARIQKLEAYNKSLYEQNRAVIVDMMNCIKAMLGELGGFLDKDYRAFPYINTRIGERLIVQRIEVRGDKLYFRYFYGEGLEEELTPDHDHHSIKRLFEFVSNEIYKLRKNL